MRWTVQRKKRRVNLKTTEEFLRDMERLYPCIGKEYEVSKLQEYREELEKRKQEMKAREREKEEERGKLEKKTQELRE